MNKDFHKRNLKKKVKEIAMNILIKNREFWRGNQNLSELRTKVKIEQAMQRFLSPSKMLSTLALRQEKKFPTIERKNISNIQINHKTKAKQDINSKLRLFEQIPKCKKVVVFALNL